MENIFLHYGSDSRLDVLLDEVRDYARAYVLSKERLKGCDGMSQHAVLAEEFRDAIDRLSSYCRDKNHPVPHFEKSDLDSIAALFCDGLPDNERTRDTGARSM